MTVSMGLPARKVCSQHAVHPGLPSKKGLWEQQLADSLQSLAPLESDSSADPPTPVIPFLWQTALETEGDGV